MKNTYFQRFRSEQHGKESKKKKKRNKHSLVSWHSKTPNENWVKVIKLMCLRNKIPKIRAILKLSGICLSYLYGCVAKWVRGKDGHSNTAHTLILYSVILNGVLCKGWTHQVINNYLTKGMKAGTAFYSESFVLCALFVKMVSYWERNTKNWNRGTVAGYD